MIVGVWSNSTYDENREAVLEEIDGFAQQALAAVYGVTQDMDSEYKQEIDENNPFWQAAQRARLDPTISGGEK